MSPEEIKKLLGGYATGTLTEAEQQALFAAALEDQELFDALAKEQPLCELLSDPAARAELLRALDVPAKRSFGFLEWLRHPMVAGLAAAGVATVAAVAVWQGARIAAVKPAPMIVAELRSEPAPAQPPAEVPVPFARQDAGKGSNALKAPAPARLAPRQAPPAAAVPPPSETPILALSKDKIAEVQSEKEKAPPPAVPTVMAELPARNAKAEAASATSAQTAGALGAVHENVALDARSLFYTNQPAPAGNAFAPRGASAGAVAAPPQTDATARTAKGVAGFVAPQVAAALRLGVRVSILRGDREVDLSTALDPGESVRLKLTPNADGFLYVVEGERLVASGAAQRLKPFETPELRFAGTGQKQLYVILSLRPRTVDPSSVGSLVRGDLVKSTAVQDRATYVVSGERDPTAQQVVVPVTLTWR